jgi:hypothetical protein
VACTFPITDASLVSEETGVAGGVLLHGPRAMPAVLGVWDPCRGPSVWEARNMYMWCSSSLFVTLALPDCRARAARRRWTTAYTSFRVQAREVFVCAGGGPWRERVGDVHVLPRVSLLSALVACRSHRRHGGRPSGRRRCGMRRLLPYGGGWLIPTLRLMRPLMPLKRLLRTPSQFGGGCEAWPGQGQRLGRAPGGGRGGRGCDDTIARRGNS